MRNSRGTKARSRFTAVTIFEKNPIFRGGFFNFADETGKLDISNPLMHSSFNRRMPMPKSRLRSTKAPYSRVRSRNNNYGRYVEGLLTV